MKKLVVIAAALLLAAAPAANAQALLNKLKEKATNAINNAAHYHSKSGSCASMKVVSISEALI